MNAVNPTKTAEDCAVTQEVSETAGSGAPPARLTIVMSEVPKTLTKRAALAGGALEFESGGQLVEGQAEIAEVATLSEFATLLTDLTPSQALIYGTPDTAPIKLVTKDTWERRGRPDGEIPRTNETFSYPKGPAIMMIDYDPEEGEEALTPEALVAEIRKAVPGLDEAEMLHWPSASSWIKNTETGAWLSELRGQRLYVMVADGRDIPRAGEAIVARLWLEGLGYMKVSAAGPLLPRTIVDGAVWQPSRLDFAAGAQCAGPLVQVRGEPKLIAGTTRIVDTTSALPDLASHKKKVVHHLQEEARKEKAEAAKEAKDAWLERQAKKIAGPKAAPDQLEAAKRKAQKALEARVLPGEFTLQVKSKGRIEEVSIYEILDAPERYNHALTRDAFEPEYRGGQIVGKLFLDGQVKVLHSFAHGGITYRLERTKSEIQIVKGKLHLAVDDTLEVLRAHPQLYDFGEVLVWLEGGALHPLDQHHLEQQLGSLVQYWNYAVKDKKVLRDPPAALTKRLLSMGKRRNLKPLVAVLTAPTLRPNGTVLDAPGYDPETKLFYHLSEGTDVPHVPVRPSMAQCKAVLETLMHPFQDFPFVESVDRGVFLAALLTSAVRRSLPKAPGFGFDAPVQGSGKTLLAQCVAELAGERNATLYPHIQGRDDEEVRKRLMSFFRTGSAAMVWDNVLGTFDSAALASALTSPIFTDRILGRSESVQLPNTAMFLFTGNNLTLQGELVRRILICRIDPRTDKPFERSFDLDPLAYVRENRGEMIAAALTLMRGSLTSKGDKPKGRMASFEAWSDLVRNAICWIDTTIAPGAFADPMSAVTRALEHDPDLELYIELLEALRAKFGEETFTSSDIHKDVQSEPNRVSSGKAHRVWEALVAIKDNAARSAATIGKVLSYRKDRFVGPYVLRMKKDSHSKTSLWRVEPAEDAEEG